MNKKVLTTFIKYGAALALLLVFTTPGLCLTLDKLETTATWTTGNNCKAGGVAQFAPPTAAHDLRIGAKVFTNQPTVTGTTTANSITFGDRKGTPLSNVIFYVTAAIMPNCFNYLSTY
jgi:hypothetical protein